MREISIEDCFTEIRNGANIKQGIIDGGYPITRIETLSNDKFNRERMGYAGISNLEKYEGFILENEDLLMSHINSVQYLGRTVLYKKVDDEIIIHGMNLLKLKPNKDIVDPAYIKYLFYGRKFRDNISKITKKSVNQASFAVGDLKKIIIELPEIKEQSSIVDKLDRLEKTIELRKEQLVELDNLIKSRFVEMFGDLKLNTKGWEMQEFNEFASIDTKMVKDFDKYANYPHIGIDSIEKDTGELKGYRTVTEDGVISGKYLFTPEHIIYSKIRPNLNKVAMPNFEGVCSADAYPILPKKDICTREFLGYTMRSDTFLSYILAFSSRTNLPKVNKNQVEGFSGPIPPIDLQNQFTTFAHQVDKLKVDIQKSLEESQLLFNSLMQEYFG